MRAFHFLGHGRLERDAVLLLTAQVFYKLNGMVLFIVLSRYLPVREIGIYFFALAFTETLMLLGNLNLNLSLMRRLAAAPDQSSAQLAPFLGLRLFTGPLYLLAVTAAAMVVAREIWSVIAVVALSALLEDLYFVFGHAFLALRKAVYNVSIGVVTQAVFLTLCIIGMRWAPSLGVLLGANLVRSVSLVAAAAYATHRWISPLRVSWDMNVIKEGKPFILLSLVGTLAGKVNTMLLGLLAGYAVVSHYQLALNVVVASFFLPGVFSVILFPLLAAHGLGEENGRLLVRGAGVLLGLGILSGTVVFLAAPQLTRVLFGPLGDGVTPLLRFLTLLFPLSFLSQFLSSALQALHQESNSLRALAVGAGVGILASGTLIPLMGASGAVVARLAAVLIQLGILIWLVRARFRQPEPDLLPMGEPGTLLSSER